MKLDPQAVPIMQRVGSGWHEGRRMAMVYLPLGVVLSHGQGIVLPAALRKVATDEPDLPWYMVVARTTELTYGTLAMLVAYSPWGE